MDLKVEQVGHAHFDGPEDDGQRTLPTAVWCRVEGSEISWF